MHHLVGPTPAIEAGGDGFQYAGGGRRAGPVTSTRNANPQHGHRRGHAAYDIRCDASEGLRSHQSRSSHRDGRRSELHLRSRGPRRSGMRSRRAGVSHEPEADRAMHSESSRCGQRNIGYALVSAAGPVEGGTAMKRSVVATWRAWHPHCHAFDGREGPKNVGLLCARKPGGGRNHV